MHSGIWTQRQHAPPETVLIQDPSTAESVSNRHVLKATVVERKILQHKYKVKFVTNHREADT